MTQQTERTELLEDLDTFRSALIQVREALMDEIDGSTEATGRDVRLSAIIAVCDKTLKSVF